MASTLTKKDKRTLSEILMESVRAGKDVQVISALLHAGADPNYRDTSIDPKGYTPLFAASASYYVPKEGEKLVAAFKAAGADLFATDSTGHTAADYAGFQNNFALEKSLRKAMMPIKCKF